MYGTVLGHKRRCSLTPFDEGETDAGNDLKRQRTEGDFMIMDNAGLDLWGNMYHNETSPSKDNLSDLLKDDFKDSSEKRLSENFLAGSPMISLMK